MRWTLFFMVQLSIWSCAGSETPAMQHLPDTTPVNSIHPDSTMHPFDLQGHRGARGLLPENTIPAFERALALGVTTLEMDVVISKDNQVVVSHDPWFSGEICSLPSGAPVPLAEERRFKIYEMTYDEIRPFDCGIRGNPRFPTQQKMRAHKPLLKDVIQFTEHYDREQKKGTTQPPVLYNIETKSNPAGDNILHPEPELFTQLLMDVLEEEGILERTTIQSFDPRTLRIAHQRNPDVSLALLVGNHDRMDLAGHIEHLGFVPRIYSPDYKLVDKKLVDDAHALNMLVLPWTVNTRQDMQKLIDLGVDGLITDYPDVGLALISEDP